MLKMGIDPTRKLYTIMGSLQEPLRCTAGASAGPPWAGSPRGSHRPAGVQQQPHMRQL